MYVFITNYKWNLSFFSDVKKPLQLLSLLNFFYDFSTGLFISD